MLYCIEQQQYMMEVEDMSKDVDKTITGSKPLVVKQEKGRIWSYIRNKWLEETPEERVRQSYLCILVNEYGFALNQIAEEIELTGRGSAKARADYVIWRTHQDRLDNKSPLIIVECKSDNVTIQAKDYEQGDNYARIANARFLVTHNTRETKYWRVIHENMPKSLEEIENVPHANASDKEIEELISKLKLFKENEFADLLHKCHNVIRNREKLDPAAAFDEIAKILFTKVWVERELKTKQQRENLFTIQFLDKQIVVGDPLDALFQQTKAAYRADLIFQKDEHINLKPATGREIVKLLERYNLSDTSEDIKAIAFERFLGRTFRGEIGQFFTPRSIVEFMIRMINPQEGDSICDPACGSGGFLIRFFEIVREKILADVDKQYQQYRIEIEAQDLTEEQRASLLRAKYDELQTTIRPDRKGSRIWKLANQYIFGADANERMARTGKMNMIMHGDGHGGVYHHDGFINVGGIFEERFDIVLTNPPFGAWVEPSDIVDRAAVTVPDEVDQHYEAEYGQAYEHAMNSVRSVIGEPIASLFELPKDRKSKIRTQILFIERCLKLLKPGGLLGIVLPEGVFNNPSEAYVREFCENRAFIRAVVSLPQETFYSSGADVKASLLFMQKFTEEEKNVFDTEKIIADSEIDKKYEAEIAREKTRLQVQIDEAKKEKNSAFRKIVQRELLDYLKHMEEVKKIEARSLLKDRFSYPIFLYEAERVGITATGETDQNELYPNDNTPSDVEKTCLELYQEFIRHPEAFLESAKEDVE